MENVYEQGESHSARHSFIVRMFYRYLYESRTYRDDGISIHRLCRNYFAKREKKQAMTQHPEYFEHTEENTTAPGLL